MQPNAVHSLPTARHSNNGEDSRDTGAQGAAAAVEEIQEAAAAIAEAQEAAAVTEAAAAAAAHM